MAEPTDEAPESGTVESGTVLVGTAGWSYPDWEGPVYPRPHPRGFDPLAFLARTFDCVELNASFYALPQAAHTRRWVERVAAQPRFTFLAKLHRTFTHEGWAGLPGAEARAFREGLEPLVAAGRLGALLAQFPVSFRATDANWSHLDDLARGLGWAPLVVEVRHRTFFEDAALTRLADLGVSVAWIDLPAARDHPPVGHPTPGAIGYARLHGRNAGAWFDRKAGRDERYDWLYATEDLEQIARRVKEIAAGGRQTYLITNNHYGGKAVANALELKGLLDGEKPRAPTSVRDAFPRLKASTRPEGQQTLF